jgi:hypothetical protein
LPRIFGAVFGTFFGLALLKFGNVPILENIPTPFPQFGNAPALDSSVATPTNIWEFLYNSPWPVEWAFWLLGAVAVVGVFAARFPRSAPHWLLALPFLWLVWQLVASTQTVDAHLTWPTVRHFAGCVACFYLGCFSLSRLQNLTWFWVGTFCGFALVLAVGLDQHFGGFERYRIYFRHQLELYPPARPVPPELLKKIASNRIYATLFYPNVLAGGLLIFLPAMIFAVGLIGARLRAAGRPAQILSLVLLGLGASWLYLADSRAGLVWVLVLGLAMLLSAPRWLLATLVGLAGLGCLFLSGSKGGWLLMLLLGVIFLLQLELPFGKTLKIGLIAGIVLLGIAGFALKYAGFFKKGATSVSARFDYWQAAIHTVRAKPLFGSGPGTFLLAYEQVKRPESEPARLVHNDYLEQASDSGLPGFLAFSLFVIAALCWTAPRSGRRKEADPGSAGVSPASPTPPTHDTNWQTLSVWLGLLGLALQSLFEFGLYIPALAWPFFALLGYLIGRKANLPTLHTTM